MPKNLFLQFLKLQYLLDVHKSFNSDYGFMCLDLAYQIDKYTVMGVAQISQVIREVGEIVACTQFDITIYVAVNAK